MAEEENASYRTLVLNYIDGGVVQDTFIPSFSYASALNGGNGRMKQRGRFKFETSWRLPRELQFVCKAMQCGWLYYT